MKRMRVAMYADAAGKYVGQGLNYMRFAQQIGEIILVTTDNDLTEVIKNCDVLFLPGGADVDSRRYGERPNFGSGQPNPYYEFLDEHLLEPWMKTGKPIVGVCRGMQTLNVAAGGTLWQHMEHHIGGEDRSYLDHKLYTDIENFKSVDINSYHHQGVRILAPGFKDIGWSPLGIHCSPLGRNKYFKHKWLKHEGVFKQSKEKYHMVCEVMQHETKPWVAFQYHPEDFNCDFATCMIEETIKRYKPDFKFKHHEYEVIGNAGGTWKEKKYLLM